MRSETERLILRRFAEGDLFDLHEYLSDPIVVQFEPYKPMSLEEVRENLKWRASTEEMIAVELKSDHKLIGNIFLAVKEPNTAEIGFVFNQKYWKHGYAFEACKKLIAIVIESGVERIIAECDPENESSWRLLEKLGFSREAYQKKNVYFWKDARDQPIWKDTFIYYLEKRAFLQESDS